MSTIRPRWMRPGYDPNQDFSEVPVFGDPRQAPVIGDPALAPQGMDPQTIVDPPIGTTDVAPRGPFSPQSDLGSGMRPNTSQGAPGGPSTSLRDRFSLGDIADQFRSGGKSLMGGLGRAVDAYGARQPEARRYGVNPRQAAMDRISDLGKSLMIAGGPGPGVGFGGRLGTAVQASEQLGQSRRGEMRDEQLLGLKQQANMISALEASQKSLPKLSDIRSERDQFYKQSKNFVDAAEAFDQLQTAFASPDTRMSDSAMVTLFARVLDPRTGVRGNERDAIAGIKTIPETVRDALLRAFDGQGELSPHDRAVMWNMAQDMFLKHRDKQARFEGDTRKVLERLKYNPDDIVVSKLGPYAEFSAEPVPVPKPPPMPDYVKGLANMLGVPQGESGGKKSDLKPGVYPMIHKPTGQVRKIRVNEDGSQEFAE